MCSLRAYIQRERLPGVKTTPGPLAELLTLRLADLTAPTIEAWAAKEAKDTQAPSVERGSAMPARAKMPF